MGVSSGVILIFLVSLFSFNVVAAPDSGSNDYSEFQEFLKFKKIKEESNRKKNEASNDADKQGKKESSVQSTEKKTNVTTKTTEEDGKIIINNVFNPVNNNNNNNTNNNDNTSGNTVTKERRGRMKAFSFRTALIFTPEGDDIVYTEKGTNKKYVLNTNSSSKYEGAGGIVELDLNLTPHFSVGAGIGMLERGDPIFLQYTSLSTTYFIRNRNDIANRAPYSNFYFGVAYNFMDNSPETSYYVSDYSYIKPLNHNGNNDTIKIDVEDSIEPYIGITHNLSRGFALDVRLSYQERTYQAKSVYSSRKYEEIDDSTVQI